MDIFESKYFVIFLILIGLLYSIRFVPANMKGIVFRLGKAIGVKDPGMVFIIPAIDILRFIPVTTTAFSIKNLVVLTKDNRKAIISLQIFYRIINPMKACCELDYEAIFKKSTREFLETFCINYSAVEVSQHRSKIEQDLQHSLYSVLNSAVIIIERIKIESVEV